ncbi:MAG TPA: ABC transporter permease [Candidatus Rokubacteria bacterium]|nr:MAG: ABC transporter permease [Candidatus Rokubacteria bacterium GWA2_70_23]OGK90850.1 MAG: ABC transporter permease [Candidatus Rokubacteria bacterium GWF2_70_14]HAM54920.1 ABC transporter permease [Candidatus Rokubacteria bacterium]
MRWWPVFKKEMRLYFGSPVAYVVGTFFLVISGWFFSQILLFYNMSSMQAAMQPQMAQSLNPTEGILRPLFSNMAVVLLFFMPMVTMRLFAEEKRAGTLELLLTYPVRDGEILLGKFLAAGALYVLLLGLTLLYPGMVSYFARVEWGAVMTGYLGLLLLGGTFLAVGILLSSMTENQIVAGFATFGILLGLWVVGWGADFAGGTLRTVLQYVSITDHMDSFSKGVLDTKDVVYYVTAMAFALFLALRSLEAKRWKG